MLAEKLGMSLVNFDMSLVLETEEVMGHRAIEDGSTLFKLNEFAQKVQEGNVIIVLDELNRTFAGALNALFPFLDHRRGNNFQGQQIKVGKRVLLLGLVMLERVMWERTRAMKLYFAGLSFL